MRFGVTIDAQHNNPIKVNNNLPQNHRFRHHQVVCESTCSRNSSISSLENALPPKGVKDGERNRSLVRTRISWHVASSKVLPKIRGTRDRLRNQRPTIAGKEERSKLSRKHPRRCGRIKEIVRSQVQVSFRVLVKAGRLSSYANGEGIRLDACTVEIWPKAKHSFISGKSHGLSKTIGGKFGHLYGERIPKLSSKWNPENLKNFEARNCIFQRRIFLLPLEGKARFIFLLLGGEENLRSIIKPPNQLSKSGLDTPGGSGTGAWTGAEFGFLSRINALTISSAQNIG
ncbi:hypothetical protein Tco_0001480 [Tanacetum coccineum]